MSHTQYGTEGDDPLLSPDHPGDAIIYGLGGNDFIIGSAASDRLYGGDGNDTVWGGEGPDLLEGGAGDDIVNAGGEGWVNTLSGGDGNDWLYADTLYDELSGGEGNDVYVVPAGAGFRFVANDPGQDRFETSGNFTLEGLSVEDLTLTGSGAVNGTGNAFANNIFGNNAANALDGGGGNDLIRGFGGNDRLTGGFDVGGGQEYLYGGTGDDTFVVMDLQDTPVDFAGEGNDTVESSIRWVLSNQQIENLTLTGAADINGFGNDLANNMTGNSGANYLDGGNGLDRLSGGVGNDRLAPNTTLIDGGYTWDTVVEVAGEGTDTVYASADIGRYTYTLGANVENLIAIGVSIFRLWGNELNNGLTGNGAANEFDGFAGNDFLDGLGGLDTLAGGIGNDTYVLNDLTFIDDQSGWRYDAVVEAANGGIDKVFVGYQGNNSYFLPANVENGEATGVSALTLVGNELGNILTGNSAYSLIYGEGGNDTLDGRHGYDDLIGGGGNDVYILADATSINGALQFDSVGEADGGGIDTVQVLSTTGRATYVVDANVENAVATGGSNFNLTGNALVNSLVGNAAANLLDGLGGADTLTGFAGDDKFYVDNALDKVIESAGQGDDTVYSFASFTLGAGQEIETLAARDQSSTVALAFTGNAFANRLIGNNGENALDGVGGIDSMYGRGGSDKFYVNLATDKVFEAIGGGADDTVFATVSYALGVGQEIETLAAKDQATTNPLGLTGNEIANRVIGNAGGNVINGKAGSDILYGRAGADTFAFDTALGAANIDRIVDFSAADDTIRLENAVFKGLPNGPLAQAAFFVGAAAHDLDDRIVYNTVSGALLFDIDGNKAGGIAAVQFASIPAGLALTNADFVVV